MLRWLRTREVDELARTIAARLTERIPYRGIDPSDKKALRKLLQTQQSILEQVERFARAHPLNLYQKASFGNTHKWALKEAGYPAPVIEAWTHEVVAHLALMSERPPSKR